MEIKIDRSDLLNGDFLQAGRMFEVCWPRLTDKKAKDKDGKTVIVQPKGTEIVRRLVVRSDWTKATPSRSFVPKGGVMFNAVDQASAAMIREVHKLRLFLSLEGVTHPHGEKDHPVNVPFDRVQWIRDTHTDITYRVSN